jgi:hypothetical protein
MGVTSRFAIEIPPHSCAYFKQKENHLYAWCSSSGRLYCSELCADDEEEAAFQNKRRAIYLLDAVGAGPFRKPVSIGNLSGTGRCERDRRGTSKPVVRENSGGWAA